jgi:hypothetical protein
LFPPFMFFRLDFQDTIYKLANIVPMPVDKEFCITTRQIADKRFVKYVTLLSP